MPTDAYSNDNLKFRRAVIRERLSAIRSERDKLLSEKETIERKLQEEELTKASERAVRSRLSGSDRPPLR